MPSTAMRVKFMAYSIPVQGMVLRCAFLWSHDAKAGRDDGSKTGLTRFSGRQCPPPKR
jgi:hypothetical protein